MNKSWVESGFRMMLRWVHLEASPAAHKRKIRQLEKELGALRAENTLQGIRLEKAREDHEKLENVIRGLLLNESAYEDKIQELESKIIESDDKFWTAVNSAWSNEQSVSFTFFDRPADPYVDQATSPIDVTELRAALAAPVTGKITQYNSQTGRHDTVELDRSILGEEMIPQAETDTRANGFAAMQITLLAPGFDGSIDPAHVPGMVLVS